MQLFCIEAKHRNCHLPCNVFHVYQAGQQKLIEAGGLSFGYPVAGRADE
jgi:hypothetical protein